MLNFFVQWGVGGILVLYVWLFLASGIAAQRMGQRSGWFVAVMYLLMPLNSMLFIRDQDRFHLFPMLLSLVSFVLPLIVIIVYAYDLTSARPFRSGLNFLLFQPPGESEPAPDSRRRRWVIGFAGFWFGVSLLSLNLYPCYWLDRMVGLSGCRQVMTYSGLLQEVAVAPASATVAIASAGATLWDSADWRRVATFARQSRLDSVALTSNGTLLAIGGWTMDVQVIDTGTQTVLFTIPNSDAAESLAFSPDGTILALGHDRLLRLWNVGEQREIQTLETTGDVYALAFAPDGRTLVSGGYESDVTVWDTLTWTPRVVLEATAYDVALSPDSRLIAVAGYANTLTLIDGARGAVVRRFVDPVPSTRDDAFSYTWSAEFDSTGNRLVSGTGDGVVRIWDVATGQVLARIQFPSDVRTVAFLDAEQALLIGLWDDTLRLWRDPTAAPQASLPRHTAGTYAFTAVSRTREPEVMPDS